MFSSSHNPAYVPGPTFGFVKTASLIRLTLHQVSRWAAQTSRVRVSTRSWPSLPLVPTLIDLWAFDLVSSPGRQRQIVLIATHIYTHSAIQKKPHVPTHTYISTYIHPFKQYPNIPKHINTIPHTHAHSYNPPYNHLYLCTTYIHSYKQLLIYTYTHSFHITQPHRSGRIWHKVNF